MTNRPDIVDAGRAMAKKMSPADIAAVQRGMAERPDSIPTLATINVPTLIIAGEDDSVPLGEFELMHQRIGGSQLTVISKAGHYAAMERPDRVWAAAADVLRRSNARMRIAYPYCDMSTARLIAPSNAGSHVT